MGKTELTLLMRLLRQYVDEEMDQHEHFSFVTDGGIVAYVEIALETPFKEAYEMIEIPHD